jgi:hypothetical protein
MALASIISLPLHLDGLVALLDWSARTSHEAVEILDPHCGDSVINKFCAIHKVNEQEWLVAPALFVITGSTVASDAMTPISKFD